ncbi:MAG: LysM peptidoglycan-binding domain-containing protein [Ilumatobacteraceae bacterium]
MALALHSTSPTLIYGRSPYRRRSHLRLVVSEPAITRTTQRPTARVYRHRRLGVALAGLLLLGGSIFGFGVVFGGSARAVGNGAASQSVPHVVIAQPGDTLWAIARRIIPVGSITGLVDQLVEMNGDEIVAGQEVRIP